MINYSKTDIDRDLAVRAYSGTSWSPEVRADNVIDSYIAHMGAVAAEFSQYANGDNRDEIADALERYQAGYLHRLNLYLNVHSRVMSSMIAGPANFPVESQRKKGDLADRRRDEWLDYQTKTLARLRKTFDPKARANAPISSDDADAIEKLQAKIARAERIQEAMKAANRMVRKKNLTDGEKVKALRGLGIGEHIARRLLEPDFAGRVGYAPYELQNNNANIRRMKERIADLERAQSWETVERQVKDGVTLVENVEENRLQIIFEDKPPADMRTRLKAAGFRWAPSQGAWQRQLNNNARMAAERVLATDPPAP